MRRRARSLYWSMFACALCLLTCEARADVDGAAPPVMEEKALTPMADAMSAVGAPLVAIEVEAPLEEDASTLLNLTDLRPGYLLSVADVQAAVQRLYALGRFSQVSARVVPTDAPGAFVLRFVLAPIIRIERIDIKGVDAMSDTSLRDGLGVANGEEVDSRTEQRIFERGAKHAALLGFPLARLALKQAAGKTPGTVVYTVHVTEGPAVRIEQVDVAGNLPVRRAVLAEGLYARPGAIANGDKLEQDRKLLETKLHQHGFKRAQVKLLPLEESPGGARVRFVVDAHERMQLHLRGNHLLPTSVLFDAWPHELDGSPEALLPLYRQRIQAMYAKESYPHTRVKTLLLPANALRRGSARREAFRQTLGRRARKTVDIFVRIDEGPPVWVRKLDLDGHSAFPASIWQQQVTGRLASEVSSDNFFSPLGQSYRAREDGAMRGLPAASHHIPPEERWVADVYGEAAGDVATALGELGFLQVKTAAPLYQGNAIDDSHVAPPLVSGDEGDRSHIESLRARNVRRAPSPIDANAGLRVHDGPQTFISRLSIRGNESFSASDVRAIIVGATGTNALNAPLTPGAPLSPANVEDARIALTKALRNLGHLYAKVEATLVPETDDPSRVLVDFDIEEGPRVRIEHVLIRGNRYTRAGIIKSRLSLKPNDVYRLEQAVDDQQQVMALGTFTRVRVKLIDEEHQNERKDVVVEVEERPRQLVEVMPGISSTQGPRLSSSYTHLNAFGTASTFVASLKLNRQMFFGLFGRYADNLRARYHAYRGIQQLTHAIEREVRVGLRAPPLRALWFDPLFRIDVVEQRINAVRYGLDAATITLGADLRFLRRLSGAVEVQGGIASLECPLGDNCDDTRGELRRLRGGRPIQQGRYDTIKVGPWLRYEGRNDPISPSRGWLLWGRVTQVFGQARRKPADFAFRFVKYEAQATTYVPLGKVVLALGLRAGTNQIQRSQVPVDERFFLGGRDSLRGFVEGTMIADDACVVDDADGALPSSCVERIVRDNNQAPLSLGGNTFALVKTELRLPVRGGLSFDLFADVGNLWVDVWHIHRFRVRTGTGVGLRYATPVGAMTLDFGVNPARRAANAEAPWQIHFSIGSY